MTIRLSLLAWGILAALPSHAQVTGEPVPQGIAQSAPPQRGIVAPAPTHGNDLPNEDWWAKTEPVIEKSWAAIRPYAERAAWTIAWPVRKIGIEPSGYGLAVAALFSWWCWGTALRLLLWTLPGRIGGWYDIKYARLWLLFFSPPWRMPLSWLSKLAMWWRQVRYRGANRKFMGLLRKMTFVFRPGKTILVGVLSHHRIRFFQPIGLPDMKKGGLCITAAVGSGKSVHLQAMGGSMHPKAAAAFVDCDGAMVRALAPGLIRAGHKVVKFDPDQIDSTIPSGRINLMDELQRAENRHGAHHLQAFAHVLSSAFIVPDSQTQPVFCNTVRGFASSGLLFVHRYEPPERRTLMRFRELITGGLPEMAKPGEHPVDALLRVMRSKRGDMNDGCGGLIGKAIAEGADVMPAAEKDGNASFWSTLRYQTAWMSDAALAPHMSGRSDVCGEDLKLTNTVVFLVGSLQDIKGRLAPLVRAYMMAVMYAFQRIPGELKRPTTLYLDESGNLGRLEMLPLALTGFRKYGLRVVAVFQSLQQAQTVYPGEWREFYGQAQATIWMGLEDPGTLKYLSEEVLGKTTRKEKIEGTPWWKFWGQKIPSRYQQRESWLLDQNQCADVLNPATEQIIVKPFGLPAMILRRAKHYIDLPVWKQEPSHPENWLKSSVRSIYNRRRARAEKRHAFREFVSAGKEKAEQSSPAPSPVATIPQKLTESQPGPEPENGTFQSMTRLQIVFFQLLHPEDGSFSTPAFRAVAHAAFAADIARGMGAGALCEGVMKSKQFTMPERRELLKAFMEALAATPGREAKAGNPA